MFWQFFELGVVFMAAVEHVVPFLLDAHLSTFY
jgi:hypothetical protein